ncbi:MAG: LysR family transcriptional regulator [Chloroflexi bacterium]|nr:LysR family transcriptional regulator [Chloroflexota bacterium]
MEIRQLEIFCVVADERGFSVAADKLGLTQPTVSFQIASLEEELGTRLLDRGGRTTMLTKSGEVLYRYARQILELNDEAKQAIHSLIGLLWGEVALGASTIPGEYILPGLLQKFREGHPGIDITMKIGDTASIIRNVLENEVELGVVGASEKNDKLVFEKFVSDELVIIAPAQNRWFSGNIVSLDDLKKAPFVLRESGSGTRAIIGSRLKETGTGLEDLNIAMVLGSTEAVKRAVQSGAGVSVVSERAVQNEVKLGTIKVFEIDGIKLARDFYLVHRRQKVLSPAAEALLEFLKEAGE